MSATVSSSKVFRKCAWKNVRSKINVACSDPDRFDALAEGAHFYLSVEKTHDTITCIGSLGGVIMDRNKTILPNTDAKYHPEPSPKPAADVKSRILAKIRNDMKRGDEPAMLSFDSGGGHSRYSSASND
jgi:hypothetical protein